VRPAHRPDRTGVHRAGRHPPVAAAHRAYRRGQRGAIAAPAGVKPGARPRPDTQANAPRASRAQDSMRALQGSAWERCCAGATASLPVLFGVIPFGLVLGAQAARAGLTPVEVPLMTGLNFAGGSEFAALGLWSSPPHVLLIMAVTFLVNSRMLVMSAAMTPFLRSE